MKAELARIDLAPEEYSQRGETTIPFRLAAWVVERASRSVSSCIETRGVVLDITAASPGHMDARISKPPGIASCRTVKWRTHPVQTMGVMDRGLEAELPSAAAVQDQGAINTLPYEIRPAERSLTPRCLQTLGLGLR